MTAEIQLGESSRRFLDQFVADLTNLVASQTKLKLLDLFPPDVRLIETGKRYDVEVVEFDNMHQTHKFGPAIETTSRHYVAECAKLGIRVSGKSVEEVIEKYTEQFSSRIEHKVEENMQVPENAEHVFHFGTRIEKP